MPQSSPLCRIAISILLVLALALPSLAATGGVGTVTHLSGPLFAKKTGGSMRTLAVNSPIEQGDTVVAEKRTYGKIKFIDGGEVTLRPGSSFVVENYHFDKNKPDDDKAVLGLLKGSLRAVTGQVSKRGNQDAYKMKAPTATIGVRGTSYDLRVCDNNCPGLANGIYFLVMDGRIEVSNGGGATTFAAGMYGYVKDSNSVPVILPVPPKLDFQTPPLDNKACGVR